MLYAALAVILILLAALLFVKLHLCVEYDGMVSLYIKALGIRFKIPVKEKAEMVGAAEAEFSPKNTQSLSEFLENAQLYIDLYGRWADFIRRKVHVSLFRVRLEFGTGDAASTGILSGGMWALIWQALGVLDRVFEIEKPDIDIIPVFGSEVFKLSFSGILSSRVVNIIIITIITLINYIKFKDGVKNGRTSD